MIRLSGSISVVVPFVLGVLISLGCGNDDDNKGTNSQNHPPDILSLAADPDTFLELQTTTITVIAEDPDDDALHYNWEWRSPEIESLSAEANTVVLTTCSCIVEPITTIVLSIVNDGRGGEARDSIRIWVLPKGGQ